MAVIPQVITEDRASGATVIEGSLKYGDSTNATGPYLSRTASAGNRKTWTLSCWIKRNAISDSNDQRIFTGRAGNGSGTQGFLKFKTSDVIEYVDSGNSASLNTSAKFRDTGWYHIVAVWDTTNSTANDRLRLYVNGEQITDFSTRVNPSQNYDGVINTAIEHGICRITTLNQNYNACRMSQVYFLDGLALDPSYF